jgi:hypothetical protein
MAMGVDASEPEPLTAGRAQQSWNVEQGSSNST